LCPGPEAAWRLLAPFAGKGERLLNAHVTVFQPYYDKAFGESPSYRAYMAGIEAQQ
jgi:hypothetical protein